MDELNVILPVFNERESLEAVLSEWKKNIDKLAIRYHFIICEDGSSDGTKELLRTIKNRYKLILKQKNERRGYGRAMIDGIKNAKAKYILCIDSDGQCDPKDFKIFWQNRDEAGIILGRRTKRADPLHRMIFSTFFRLVYFVLFSSNIKDPSCPYVLFKKNTVVPYLNKLVYLNEGFWWGFSGVVVLKNFSLYQIKINHRKRFKGDTHVYKLTNILDIAIRNIVGLIRLRFTNLK